MSYNWLDVKYLSLLSFRLRNFKKKGSNIWNMSCPYCSDSIKNPKKARGYVYLKSGNYIYYCHKCNIVKSVELLIKHLDQNIYEEYIREKITADPKLRLIKSPIDDFNFTSKPKFAAKSPLGQLTKISNMPEESVAFKFVKERCLPNKYYSKLYYCEHFKKWVNSFLPEKFESEELDEARLIIPFLDKDRNLIGVQGRSFIKNSPLRYITIMLDEAHPKIYGLDDVNLSKDVFVFEGPLDSQFVENSIASAGGNLTSDLKLISDNISNFVIVYDAEKRNKYTIKKMERAIDLGFRICIWPENIKEKDINDMVLAGYTQEQITSIIKSNIYRGLAAKAQLSQWKKVN